LSQALADSKGNGGTWRALRRFVAAKLSGGLQRRPPRASDLAWSALGMAAFIGALALLAGRAGSLPIVGPAHQRVGRV
jgi:hypothetical protein